ncbi:MAG: ATP-binding protein [Spirosomataceae bacterium]
MKIHSNWSVFKVFAVVVALCVVSGYALAQQQDTTRKATKHQLQLSSDTTNMSLEDKYILSELEKVQYAKYSENLKEETIQKALENQRLQTASLQQKLQNEQIKAEAQRKQAEARQRQQEQERQIKQLEINQLNQQVELQNRTRNFLFGGLVLLSLLGVVLFWSNQQLKKRNRAIQRLSADNLLKEQEKQLILANQNETLERQVEARTAELKASQNQLIQKEKLASLGELTAGIAHEIQNPLNFVNNFSELSVELVDELKSPLTPDGGIKDGERVDMELLEDIVQNLEKINLHGKRASSIVKGMLEHSRMGTGERVLTDINKLADEYLRLSYHGLRAKSSSFQADYELIAGKDLPLVKVVPQELGRVLLNLMNNAFYAVSQSGKPNPKVIVKSDAVVSNDGSAVEIRIQDNGVGIPDAIKDKIFQPFFTTKPTGEGTGLGLSLSYDIITKGHGGTIEVESIEGEGTTFVVKLPMQ